jgi:Bacterial regulatory proteins, tetR family.
VPKQWNETIEEHRRAVRDATLETTTALVAEHGLRAVTMSQIAEEIDIGRATLPYWDVERDAAGSAGVRGRSARTILPGNERATLEATSAAGRGSLRSQ